MKRGEIVRNVPETESAPRRLHGRLDGGGDRIRYGCANRPDSAVAARRVNSVGEQDDEQFLIRIHPEGGSGEPRVAKRAGAEVGAGRGIV